MKIIYRIQNTYYQLCVSYNNSNNNNIINNLYDLNSKNNIM